MLEAHRDARRLYPLTTLELSELALTTTAVCRARDISADEREILRS
jgi:hypothetical protein